MPCGAEAAGCGEGPQSMRKGIRLSATPACGSVNVQTSRRPSGAFGRPIRPTRAGPPLPGLSRPPLRSGRPDGPGGQAGASEALQPQPEGTIGQGLARVRSEYLEVRAVPEPDQRVAAAFSETLPARRRTHAQLRLELIDALLEVRDGVHRVVQAVQHGIDQTPCLPSARGAAVGSLKGEAPGPRGGGAPESEPKKSPAFRRGDGFSGESPTVFVMARSASPAATAGQSKRCCSRPPCSTRISVRFPLRSVT